MFLTGVAVSVLFEQAEKAGRRAALVAALKRGVTVCRGPKPTAALRGFGVEPSLTAASSFTAAEVVDELAHLEVSGRRTLLFHYGERANTLAETLRARGADLEEIWLYRWLMPEDTSKLEDLVVLIINGEVDALAVTSQIQFRHLSEVAKRLGLGRQFVRALNERVVVAAVGPTCQAVLEAHEVRVRVMPEYPKMGPLIVALMRHLGVSGSQGRDA
jgi:uroporphyrinogen-III synthase